MNDSGLIYYELNVTKRMPPRSIAELDYWAIYTTVNNSVKFNV